MHSTYVLVALAMAGSSFATAFGALWFFGWMFDRKTRTARALVREEAEATVFIFDDQVLVDATDPAHKLLANRPRIGNDWARLLTQLSRNFPNLNEELGDLADVGQITVSAQNPGQTMQVHAEWWDGLTRIELTEDASKAQTMVVDRFSQKALEEELETLRATADRAPFLVWQQSENGTISWANRSYLDIVRKTDSETAFQSWPPARLFDQASLAGPTSDGRPRRLPLKSGDTKDTRWFEAYCSVRGDDTLYFAVEADAVVKAENALRNFVQTLTKTFAHLTIGLAIFDRDRQLALFNPALTDLTTLPADFLSGRPTLYAFLDRLRDKHMMPEPKDYKSWRQQLTALEAAAADGTYEENWTLPTGQTYRVTGRPHPDGAVAFLFADISAEISLTRRFRSELEVGQAVVDAMDEAIAVFSPNGALTMSNQAFERIWGVDPSSTLGEYGILDATRLWHKNCEPTPIWGDIRESVEVITERADWSALARLNDGRLIQCRITPLSGGATLVGFSVEPSGVVLAAPEPGVTATA